LGVVLLTDRAWPDDRIEREIIESAGHSLVGGPAVAGTAAEVEAMALAHAPSAIMTCWAPVSASAIASPPGLKIVARMGVGLDNIDVAAASARGAIVTNVPDYCLEEVSDHAVAMLLALARDLVGLDRAVKGGVWAPASARLWRVRDMTVGIFGMGRIGARTARKLDAFGVKLIAHNRGALPRSEARVESVSFDGLIDRSDAIILHAPLTAETHHRFDDAVFARMRPGALLINVSRGPIIDNGALVRALERRRLAGTALDVVEGEPAPPADLVGRPDVIVTPHVGFSSVASLAELRRRAAEEVVRVLNGEAPRHPCNIPVLPP
jgi:D-3-phosphoglycerate dehydrogenase